MRLTPDRQTFHVEIIKPSRYDDDGYVVQWWRAIIPSNSLACLCALALAAGRRRALGDGIDIAVNVYDESSTVIPVERITRRLRGGRGMVLLAGVQSNQFARAADLARAFRASGIPVAIGGFHVSGCLAMLPELPGLREMQDLGVALFAGRRRPWITLVDAHRGSLSPLQRLKDLPDLRPGDALPPADAVWRSMSTVTFDAGAAALPVQLLHHHQRPGD